MKTARTRIRTNFEDAVEALRGLPMDTQLGVKQTSVALKMTPQRTAAALLDAGFCKMYRDSVAPTFTYVRRAR